MSFKGIVRELKEMKEGIGNLSRRGGEGGRHWRGRTRSHIAPDQAPPCLDERVEVSETVWPARSVVVFCAAVCRSWREVTKEIVQTPEQCGRLTFPISLKQPGPRDSPIQCFIKRDRATSTFRLFYGLTPSEDENDKLLLAARKIRRATSTDFFTVYDSQPPQDSTVKANSRPSRRFHSKQVSPRVPAYNYSIATISYELSVLRTRGPRRLHCVVHAIPLASIQEGGSAPTPQSFPQSFDDQCPPSPFLQGKRQQQPISFSSTSLSEPPPTFTGDRLTLKNKAPRWHEQLQCWCLNFRGRVTVASVKNFQLVAAVEPRHNIPAAEQDQVLLQFGKIGKDIFTMDYRYPLLLFKPLLYVLVASIQKPACE
ncbi:Tubby-like F-box protein 5 [Bienertia sinuspersici]